MFGVGAFIYLVVIIAGLVTAWPWGIFGFVALALFGFLFGWVLKDRAGNKEDDYYSKNVDK